jgi:hypothetical protein
MNAFEKHGIKHLSPSSLALYKAEPAFWCGRYLLGWKDEGGPKMWVGNAVEAGLHAFLHGWGDEDCKSRAMTEFESKALGVSDEPTDAARAEIVPMLEQAMTILAKDKDSKPLYQVPVKHWVEGLEVPIIGYLDFAFPDGVLDLKTTRALPSKPKADHAAQVAFYCKARDCANGSLLYVTTKKGAVYALSPDDLDRAYGSLIVAARAIQTLLRNSPTKQEAMRTFAPDFESFYWSESTLKQATDFWRPL